MAYVGEDIAVFTLTLSAGTVNRVAEGTVFLDARVCIAHFRTGCGSINGGNRQSVADNGHGGDCGQLITGKGGGGVLPAKGGAELAVLVGLYGQCGGGGGSVVATFHKGDIEREQSRIDTYLSEVLHLYRIFGEVHLNQIRVALVVLRVAVGAGGPIEFAVGEVKLHTLVGEHTLALGVAYLGHGTVIFVHQVEFAVRADGIELTLLVGGDGAADGGKVGHLGQFGCLEIHGVEGGDTILEAHGIHRLGGVIIGHVLQFQRHVAFGGPGTDNRLLARDEVVGNEVAGLRTILVEHILTGVEHVVGAGTGKDADAVGVGEDKIGVEQVVHIELAVAIARESGVVQKIAVHLAVFHGGGRH